MINPYLQHILDFHTQFEPGKIKLQNADKIKNAPRPDSVVICGMGASLNTGKIIYSLRHELNLGQIVLGNDYFLPEHSFKNPLYLFISFSGKTEETISCLQEFLQKKKSGLGAVVSTFGSPLEKLALDNNLIVSSFDGEDLMPRESIGILFTAARIILAKVFGFPVEYKHEAISESLIKTADDLAGALLGKVPIIFTDSENFPLGHIWKTNLNETAKMFAETSILPEIFHNEIQIFEKTNKDFVVIWIYNEETARRNEHKLTDLHKILDDKKITTFAFPIVSKNREEQIWHSVVLANLTSYNLAILQNLDPSEISIIQDLKK